MELDITDFFNNVAPSDYSASGAEIGERAGEITWGNACSDSRIFMLLDTPDKKEAFIDCIVGFGAWTEDELKAYSEIELNALCIQFISSEMRDTVGFDMGSDTTPEQWSDYQSQAEHGLISGSLFKTDDNKIYFSFY
jgi:hypothetical protein